MTIYFKVVNQTLTLLLEPLIAENSLLYLKAAFELDEEWSDANVIKTAVFTKRDGTAYHVLFGSGGCADNEAFVAQEVLREGFFTVGLIGVKRAGNSTIRITTNVVTVNVKCSAAIEGENTDTTPSLVDQLIEKVEGVEEKAERTPYIGQDGYWYYYSYDDPEGWVQGEKAQGPKGDPGSDASITVDPTLDGESENPVQNKAVVEGINELIDHIDQKYTKPNEGIPLTDLVAQVQSLLNHVSKVFLYDWDNHDNRYVYNSHTSSVSNRQFAFMDETAVIILAGGENDGYFYSYGFTKFSSDINQYYIRFASNDIIGDPVDNVVNMRCLQNFHTNEGYIIYTLPRYIYSNDISSVQYALSRTITDQSTDTEIPTAKAVYNALQTAGTDYLTVVDGKICVVYENEEEQ